MKDLALQFGNLFFLVFHTALIVFNCAGWAWKKTRRANLVTLCLTMASWFVMGLWHGIGYCICTDWHWQIRRALGYRDGDDTYIDFLVRSVTGWTAPPSLTRAVAGWALGISVVLSVGLNIMDWRRRRKALHPSSPNP